VPVCLAILQNLVFNLEPDNSCRSRAT